MGLPRLAFWCNWTPTTQQTNYPFGFKPWWQMLYHMMCWLRVLCCIPWDLYWTFGRKLFFITLGGNHEMGFKLNSLSNILHEVLDQSMVLSCWSDLLTHYLGNFLIVGEGDWLVCHAIMEKLTTTTHNKVGIIAIGWPTRIHSNMGHPFFIIVPKEGVCLL